MTIYCGDLKHFKSNQLAYLTECYVNKLVPWIHHFEIILNSGCVPVHVFIAEQVVGSMWLIQ